jgi:hypothetical protein
VVHFLSFLSTSKDSLFHLPVLRFLVFSTTNLSVRPRVSVFSMNPYLLRRLVLSSSVPVWCTARSTQSVPHSIQILCHPPSLIPTFGLSIFPNFCHLDRMNSLPKKGSHVHMLYAVPFTVRHFTSREHP